MQPDFHIGPIPVFGRVSLAPMDGISDQPFRLVCKKMGAAITISEFIHAIDVERQLNDFSHRTSFSEFERPFGYQVYGSKPFNIIKASRILEKNAPDFIDLNFGCSVRRVANRGAGAGLLKNPKKIKEIIHSLVRDFSIPVSVKMRIGWNHLQQNYLEIAKIAEGEGAQLLIVHGRRRDQTWNDPADWTSIRNIKQHVNIPVIGNGDISSKADVDRMLYQTGCDGVMIGRAAIGNPWLFSGQTKEKLPRQEILQVVLLHWSLMTAFFQCADANLRFKKHLKAYISSPQFSDLVVSEILMKKNPMNIIIQKYLPDYLGFSSMVKS